MTDETVRFLHDLKLPGMAACWTSLEETHQLDKVSLRDGMQLMLQHERDTRQANRIARLIKNAGFRQKATIEELEMDTTRGLSTADVTEQATGGYIRDARFTIVIGPTGTGKTFFVNALGERACRQGYKTLYFTMNTLIDSCGWYIWKGVRPTSSASSPPTTCLLSTTSVWPGSKGKYSTTSSRSSTTGTTTRHSSWQANCLLPTGTMYSKVN